MRLARVRGREVSLGNFPTPQVLMGSDYSIPSSSMLLHLTPICLEPLLRNLEKPFEILNSKKGDRNDSSTECEAV